MTRIGNQEGGAYTPPSEPQKSSGTHQGHLDEDARERRRIKNARYRQNRITRAEDNRNRSSRS